MAGQSPPAHTRQTFIFFSRCIPCSPVTFSNILFVMLVIVIHFLPLHKKKKKRPLSHSFIVFHYALVTLRGWLFSGRFHGLLPTERHHILTDTHSVISLQSRVCSLAGRMRSSAGHVPTLHLGKRFKTCLRTVERRGVHAARRRASGPSVCAGPQESRASRPDRTGLRLWAQARPRVARG